MDYSGGPKRERSGDWEDCEVRKQVSEFNGSGLGYSGVSEQVR